MNFDEEITKKVLVKKFDMVLYMVTRKLCLLKAV